MDILVARSAKLLNDDCDWRSLLDAFGYGAPPKSGDSA
jgi:hypothetical protein